MVGTYALSPPLERRVAIKVLLYSCCMMDGTQFGEAVPGQERYAVVVPWKSGDMETRSETTLRVDGQYLSAHCVSMFP